MVHNAFVYISIWKTHWPIDLRMRTKRGDETKGSRVESQTDRPCLSGSADCDTRAETAGKVMEDIAATAPAAHIILWTHTHFCGAFDFRCTDYVTHPLLHIITPQFEANRHFICEQKPLFCCPLLQLCGTDKIRQTYTQYVQLQRV